MTRLTKPNVCYCLIRHYVLEPIGELSAIFDSFTGETHFVSPPLSFLLNKYQYQAFTFNSESFDDIELEQQLVLAIELGMIKTL